MPGDAGLPAGLSIVIPVFNGESNCAELVGRLGKVLDVPSRRFEVLLVNDGSHDRSWALISELAQEYPWVRGVDLMRNYGQHNALLCGIRDARFEVIVTMDDDLQNPPEEIPRLLDALTDEYDVVYGTPRHARHGLWRDVASRVTKLALKNAMGIEIARSVSAFRAFRTQLRDAFTEYHNSFVSIDVLLTWGTTRFTAVPVRQDARQRGQSHYTFRKLLTHALNMLTGFSTLPLQLASLMGFVLTLFGAAILVYVLGRYFLDGDPVRGFPFLASVIAIFSGAQLFALGIIGEYLARMHFRMMARPTYVVRSLAIRRGGGA
jgi:glycosyltransferase involved in cell wall biosynthesis